MNRQGAERLIPAESPSQRPVTHDESAMDSYKSLIKAPIGIKTLPIHRSRGGPPTSSSGNERLAVHRNEDLPDSAQPLQQRMASNKAPADRPVRRY